MENIPRKTGPKPKDPSKKKVTVSLTLSPSERLALENKAEEMGLTPSQFIVKKFKLA